MVARCSHGNPFAAAYRSVNCVWRKMDMLQFISEMRNRRQGASEQELSEFEALIGKGLPEDYRQFLAMANGGDVEDDKFLSGTDDAGIRITGIGGLRELGGN